MTTYVKRSLASGPAWFSLALGIVGALILAAVVALDPWGLQHAESAATPVMVAAIPNSAPIAHIERAAEVTAIPVSPVVEDNKTEPAASTPDPEKEPIPAPIPQPAPAMAAKSAAPPHKVASERELRFQLYRAEEFGLKPTVRDALVESYKNNYQANAALGRKPTFEPSILLSKMAGVQQLPLRSYPGCQLPPDNAVTLGVLSRLLHAYLDVLAPKDVNGKRSDPKRVRTALRQERRGKPPAWSRPEALPAMVQILMAEDVPLRLILVDMMADIKGKAATVRLAQRAVYDLSPQVREAAIDALRERPVADARRTLVEALRYPWPGAADHAATALAALGDRDAAPLLVAHLDKPDPVAPYGTKTGASIRELVRVNHVENCMLCHVPAVGRDPVTDVDPFARRPSQTYRVGSYSGPQLPGGSGGVWANKVLIRADVQFLRQDFSITLPTTGEFSNAGGLRWDFLVRTRPLKPTEVQEWKSQPKLNVPTYPQRDSTLRALREITGQDAGPTTDAWMKLYPHANAEAEGVRLSAALRAALPDQREQLLARYRDSKEDHYTEGLAYAIGHIKGKFQEKVRAALVQRMARLPADDLRAYLEADGELRLAAARAIISKADADMIPDLIGLLSDVDAEIVEAAHQALQRLRGEDFGPAAK